MAPIYILKRGSNTRCTASEMPPKEGVMLTWTNATDHGPISKTSCDSVIGRGVMGSQAGQKQAAGREDTSWLESHSVFTQRVCKQACNHSWRFEGMKYIWEYNLNQNAWVISLSQKRYLPAMLPHNSATGHSCAYSEATGLHKFGDSL